MHFVIHNTQAFGDMLMGTHVAKFIKKQFINAHVTFAVNSTATLTTAETDNTGLLQMAEILLLQDGIDTVALYFPNGSIFPLLGHKMPSSKVPIKLIRQYEWYSNLGMARSMFAELFHLGFPEHNTETEFWFGMIPNRTKDKLRIATLGPTDWNKKWGNDEGRKKLLAYIEEKDVELIQFGRDIKKQSYLHALQEMQNCHLYIGPAGSMGHAAAGVGMDTVILSELFPPKYLSPEHYHSGYHKTVVATPENHCGTYKCVYPKDFTLENNQMGWGNPPVEYGAFWVQDCKYTASGKSCIASITAEQMIEKFEDWYAERGMAILG
jgi:hypothetical protein